MLEHVTIFCSCVNMLKHNIVYILYVDIVIFASSLSLFKLEYVCVVSTLGVCCIDAAL